MHANEITSVSFAGHRVVSTWRGVAIYFVDGKAVFELGGFTRTCQGIAHAMESINRYLDLGEVGHA